MVHDVGYQSIWHKVHGKPGRTLRPESGHLCGELCTTLDATRRQLASPEALRAIFEEEFYLPAPALDGYSRPFYALTQTTWHPNTLYQTIPAHQHQSHRPWYSFPTTSSRDAAEAVPPPLEMSNRQRTKLFEGRTHQKLLLDAASVEHQCSSSPSTLRTAAQLKARRSLHSSQQRPRGPCTARCSDS
jgi:hypothetical protein